MRLVSDFVREHCTSDCLLTDETNRKYDTVGSARYREGKQIDLDWYSRELLLTYCAQTTLARVIAAHTNSTFREISATSTNSQELRKQFEEASNMLKLTGKKTILFVDECQRKFP